MFTWNQLLSSFRQCVENQHLACIAVFGWGSLNEIETSNKTQIVHKEDNFYILWSVQNQPMGNVKSTAIAERDPSHTLNKVSSLFIIDFVFSI